MLALGFLQPEDCGLAFVDAVDEVLLEAEAWLAVVELDHEDQMEAPELLPLEDDAVLVLSEAEVELEEESRVGIGTGPPD